MCLCVCVFIIFLHSCYFLGEMGIFVLREENKGGGSYEVMLLGMDANLMVS